MRVAAAGSPLILVFGMHRSGTSALTRAIAFGGAGLPRTLLEPRRDNEGGYWESARLVALDESMLRALGTNAFGAWSATLAARLAEHRAGLAELLARAYRRELPDDRPVVVKDPRMCLLARAHLDAVQVTGRAALAVLVLRDPAASHRSLAQRNGLALAYAQLLWRQHVLISEFETRDVPRLVVRHDEFLRDPVAIVARVFERAGLSRPPNADQIRAWVDPNRVSALPRGAEADAASRAIFEQVTSTSADFARLDAWRRDAIAAGERAEPGCPSAWLDLQSEVTIAHAQVAALAAEFVGCAGKPETIDDALRGLELRLGPLERAARAGAQLVRGAQ